MKRKHKRHVLVTPAFLEARKRKNINDETRGHVLPMVLPDSTGKNGVQGNDWNYNSFAFADLSQQRINGSSRGSNSTRGRQESPAMSSKSEKRSLSAPVLSNKHMEQWMLPGTFPTKYHNPVSNERQENKQIHFTKDHLRNLSQEARRTSPKRESVSQRTNHVQALPRLSRDGSVSSNHAHQISTRSARNEEGALDEIHALFYRKLKLNRTRVQTWHGLPLYTTNAMTTNVSSMYMRPHRAIPAQFTIHPEWGACKSG